jgi:hypothetical protein
MLRSLNSQGVLLLLGSLFHPIASEMEGMIIKAMPLSESISGTVACWNRDYQIILLLFEFNYLIITVPLDTKNIHSAASNGWLKVYKIISVLCLVGLGNIGLTQHIGNRQY